MRFDNLSAPVSEDQPAGPDLDEEMDTDYLNYTLVAPDRLPTSYLDGDRKPYDRSQIELDKEVETIAGFLERSRDSRLLTLDARFHAAAGNIPGFVEATQGLALVVNTFWDDFHPKAPDGDMIVRQNTIESLDDLGQVVMHLQNATIAGGGRTRPVSLRHYLVATGKADPRPEEDLTPLDAIGQTMTNEANAARVTEIHAAIKVSAEALNSVRSVFMERAGAEFAPSFTRLQDMYDQMLGLIGTYRPDLAPPKKASATEDYEDGGGATTTEGGTVVITGAVKSHADATNALSAAETYFMTMEPSSPALILVHQSRMLIGRPLVNALEALMPEPSARAVLKFDSGFRFEINLDQMRAVTDDALANPPPPPADAGSGWGSSDTSSGWGSDSSSGWGSDASASETSGEDASASGDGWGSSEETAASDGSEDAAADGGGETSAAEEAPAAPPPAPTPPPPGSTVYTATTRAEAQGLIAATETFFRAAEPSSPIPTLLAKARTYISRDFVSILSELIPLEPTT